MSIDDGIPTLASARFADGQRLTATGLDAVGDRADQLRWLHARTLHNWGVALGLEVTGARGDRSVRVGPGYAVDRQGRELLLADPVELPVPPVSGQADGSPATYFLCAAYADPAPGAATRTPTATGAGAGAAGWPEQATLRWLDADPALGDRRGLDLVLAAVPVRGCALTDPTSGSPRRDDVPGGQPYVTAGSTPPGATPWTAWQVGTTTVGVQTTVTTTAAGFRSVPTYSAQLVGERLLTATTVGAAPTQVIVDGYSQVAEAAAGSFLFRVGLQSLRALGPPTTAPVTADDFLAVIRRFSYPGLGLYSTHTEGGATRPLSRLCTGASLTVWQQDAAGNFSPTGYHTLSLDDVNAGLTSFAARNGVDPAQVVAQNGLDVSGSSQLCLVLNQQLVVARGPAPVNAVDLVSLPDFPQRLSVELGWHVTWVGVES